MGEIKPSTKKFVEARAKAVIQGVLPMLEAVFADFMDLP